MTKDARRIIVEALAYHATPEEQVIALDWLDAKWQPVQDTSVDSPDTAWPRTLWAEDEGRTLTIEDDGEVMSVALPEHYALCRLTPAQEPQL